MSKFIVIYALAEALIRAGASCDAGVVYYLADVKCPIPDQLYRFVLIDELGEDHVFLSTHLAIANLTENPLTW